MSKIREGDLYKMFTVGGVLFEIRYGFYGDIEREYWEPMPIYPNFIENPQYTTEGFRFATADQDVCFHFKPREKISGENWCNDCIFFTLKEEIIGICTCNQRKNK